jgi:hypothetical protein
MSANNETQPSAHKKSLTIESTTAAHCDEYSGFVKTTSPRGLKEDTDSDSFFDDDIIPPTHAHRTLVLCFDGTGKSLSSLNTPPMLTVMSKGDQFDEDVGTLIDHRC